MISEYKKSDTSKILHVINDASLRYKGIIPDNCWHEPYMSEQELIDGLVKSEKFPDEDESKRFIRKLINEAAIYESKPGHYNTV